MYLLQTRKLNKLAISINKARNQIEMVGKYIAPLPSTLINGNRETKQNQNYRGRTSD